MDNDIKVVKTSVSKKVQKRDYIYAVGKQKEAVARVRLYTHLKSDQKWGEEEVSKEHILVNGVPVEKYFSGSLAKAYYTAPLQTTDTLNKFAFTVKISGGGKNGQLDAMIKGIARALVALDKEAFRTLLKKKGFLTRDSRIRERRKVGTGGKARRQKQSPKR